MKRELEKERKYRGDAEEQNATLEPFVMSDFGTLSQKAILRARSKFAHKGTANKAAVEALAGLFDNQVTRDMGCPCRPSGGWAN